jgi:hypothetical protein
MRKPKSKAEIEPSFLETDNQARQQDDIRSGNSVQGALNPSQLGVGDAHNSTKHQSHSCPRCMPRARPGPDSAMNRRTSRSVPHPKSSLLATLLASLAMPELEAHRTGPVVVGLTATAPGLQAWVLAWWWPRPCLYCRGLSGRHHLRQYSPEVGCHSPFAVDDNRDLGRTRWKASCLCSADAGLGTVERIGLLSIPHCPRMCSHAPTTKQAQRSLKGESKSCFVSLPWFCHTRFHVAHNGAT